MYQEELGRQLPSGNAKGMGLASEAGEAYQRQTQTQMGLGLWHKAIVWEAATPSHLGGNGYSSKLINTKRQCDRVILHAVSPICLSLGLRPWGLGLGRWRGERARACGV